MHWEKLPKVTHNEDEIREYERQESRRINHHLRGLIYIALPLLVLLIVWIFLR
ncbi:MAG TPA: hypothetical protein VLX61_11315 [Anaerolineales bacterium]|nr:hypothetical protein [Anaerolineales bacterium]